MIFFKVIKIGPNNSFLYFCRGFAYKSLGEYSKAVKDFKISMHLDPEFILTKSFWMIWRKKIFE